MAVISIKNSLILLLIVFFFSCGCAQNTILTKKIFQNSLIRMNEELHSFYKNQDSIFQKEAAYTIARIYGARERFIRRQHLYVDYLGTKNKIEIFDVSSKFSHTVGVSSFIYFNDKLVIYYSDMSSDTYKVICDICHLNREQLSSSQNFIVYTTINEQNEVVIQIIE